MMPRVIYDGGLFEMFYYGQNALSTSTGYAISGDGLSWSKIGWVSLDGNVLGAVKENGVYKIWYTPTGRADLYYAEGRVEASLLVVPPVLNFGDVLAGDTKILTVKIQNQRDAAVQINSIAIKADGPGIFSQDPSSPWPTQIPAGGSVDLAVRFIPDARTSYQGELSIETDDATDPKISVLLQGSGLVCVDPSDTDCDGFIDRNELDAYVDLWIRNEITLEVLTRALEIVKSQ